MRIKEVSGSTGLTERAIRYYESVGLVIPNMEEKSFRLWRDYTPEHVRLLSAVATLRRAKNEAPPRPHPGPAQSGAVAWKGLPCRRRQKVVESA